MSAEQFDIAISLLSKDLSVARALADELATHARVFLYERSQETLVGKDGLEQFRATFLTDAKLNVILYRDGYGETPWTRVELAAIQDRALRDGWGTLVVVALESGQRAPNWYPYPRISSSLADFGIKGVASVVLARARDNGAPERRESPVELAARLTRQTQDAERRRQFERSREGVESIATELRAMFDRIDHLCAEIGKDGSGQTVRWGRTPDQIVVIVGGFSLSLYWEEEYRNVVDESVLVALTFQGFLQIPGSTGRPAEEPRRLERKVFAPTYGVENSWRWWEQKDDSDTSTIDLADALLQELIKRAHGA